MSTPNRAEHWNPQVLGELDLTHLNAAVRNQRQEAAAFAAHLRPATRRIARSCRERGCDATALVVAVKQTWMSLPEVAALPRRDAAAMLEKVVSLLIEDYYASES